ncbi:MAG: hypothetical protein AB7S77_02690 [Desulfatirhabdiaceae bacterium]
MAHDLLYKLACRLVETCEADEAFDFEKVLHEIHVELEDLNAEAVQLAATIRKNFEELGI